MTIAITAANGQLGQLVIEKLKERIAPDQIYALVRTPAKAESLKVPVREADYSKPTTLATAFVGVNTVLLISSSEIGHRVEQHQNVIDAARKAGVKRIVYTSLLHADSSPISLATEHLATEKALKEAGIHYTILRNGWYTENFTNSIPPAITNGAFIGSAGAGKISSATRADYADAAVTVLTSGGHEDKTYELAGDNAYTLADLAQEISVQSGKTIPYNNLPEATYADILKQIGLPEALANTIAAADVNASQGALFDDSKTLSRLIGHPTTPLSESVKAALK